MNLEFILGKLGEIMRWDTERSRAEFAWLGLMAKIKYDGYQDFRAARGSSRASPTGSSSSRNRAARWPMASSAITSSTSGRPR